MSHLRVRATRILGLELRHSAVPGAALLVVVGVFLLYATPDNWSDGWLTLALILRENMFFLWPLALAAGAWQGRREHQSGVAELFASTPRSRARRMLPVLTATAVGFASAYGIIAVAGGASFFSPARYLPPGFFGVLAVGAVALVAAAWLGLGLGRLLPVMVTAPVLAVAGVAFVLFSDVVEPDWLAAVLSPAHGGLQQYPYQTIDGRVGLAFSTWMGALAVAGTVLLIVRRRRLFAVAVLPALAGLGLAVAVVPRAEAVTAFAIDPSAATLVCTEDAPKVCVSRVSSGVLEELTPLARQGLAILSRMPDAPAEVREQIVQYGTHPAPLDPGVVLIDFTMDRDGGLADPASVVPLMTENLGVDRYGPPCENTDSAVVRAASYYLLGREPVSAVGAIPGVVWEDPELLPRAVELWNGLRTMPEGAALERVAAVRRALITCEDNAKLLSRDALTDPGAAVRPR